MTTVPASLAVLSTLSSFFARFCEGGLATAPLLLRGGGLATAALLRVGGLPLLHYWGGLATAALFSVGKNLLLHYGRLRCAFLCTS